MHDTGDRELSFLPAEQVRSVLARAAELDASELTGLTMSDLQRIAQEAGISPRAVEQALSELRTRPQVPAAPPPQPAKKRSWLSRLGTALKLGGIAAVLGFGAGLDGTEWMGFILPLLGLVAVYRAIVNRKYGSTSEFQTEISVMSAGLLTGYFVTGNAPPELLLVIAMLGVLTGLIGTVVVSVGRKPPVSPPADAAAPHDVPFASSDAPRTSAPHGM